MILIDGLTMIGGIMKVIKLIWHALWWIKCNSVPFVLGASVAVFMFYCLQWYAGDLSEHSWV